MAKLTVNDLHRIREKTKKETSIRHEKGKIRITVHMGDKGLETGGREIVKSFMDELGRTDRDDIRVFVSDWLEECENGPAVTVQIDESPVVYQQMNAEKAREIFEKHVLGGEVQSAYTLQTS